MTAQHGREKATYRLTTLRAEPIGPNSWRIGEEGAIVSAELHRVHTTNALRLTFFSEVAWGSHIEGSYVHEVGSVEEAVAMVEERRLEAFKHDVEPDDSAKVIDDLKAEVAYLESLRLMPPFPSP